MAHTAFVPLALALLFGLVLSAPVEALHKIRVPRSLSAALILLLALAIIGGIVASMWTPTQEWFAKAPQTMTTIRQKVRPIAKFMTHMDALRRNAGNLGAQGHAALGIPAAPAAATESAPTLILDVGAPVIAGALTFLIVTLFLLTGGPPMMARMTAAFVDNLKASNVLHIIEKVRAEVGHFYLVTTLIHAGLGLTTGVAMWAWGMPTPYLYQSAPDFLGSLVRRPVLGDSRDYSGNPHPRSAQSHRGKCQERQAHDGVLGSERPNP